MSPEITRLLEQYGEDMREACASLCNERGAAEQKGFGLTRAAQNYFRARDCIRALPLPPLPEVAGEQWRPIESAPPDDTIIIAVLATEINKTFAGRRTVQPVYMDEDGRICCLTTLKPDIGITSGMWEATHWQPLPAPPTPSAASGEDADV